jgi:aminopeptidase N
MKKFIVFSIIIGAALTVPAFTQSRSVQSQDAGSDRPQLDVNRYAVEITLAPEDHRLNGVAEIQFKRLDRKNFAAFDLDRRLHVTRASANNSPVPYRQFDLDSTVEFDLSGQQFSGDVALRVEYSGILDPDDDRRDPVLAKISDSSAFLLYDGKWFPTNGLYRDKADMQLQVTVPAGWTVVSDLKTTADHPGTFSSTEPSYWGTVAAGNYSSRTVKSTNADIVVDVVKAPEEAVTPMVDTTGKILDFYTQSFGPIPSSTFHIVEVEGANWNARSSVGTLLLPSSKFTPDFDKWALARTIAHQWFPLKISAKDPSTDAWLVDGMAVFASLLYQEKTLSPAEAQESIDKALVKALAYEGTTSVRQAGGLEKNHPDYESLVAYKGAYVFRMLRWVIGEEKFQKLLSAYLEKYKSTPATTDGFTQLASQIAGEDLGYFFDQWLNSSGVPEFKNEYTVFRTKDGYKVSGQIKQDLDLFKMPVELQVQTDGEPEYKRVEVVGASSDFDIITERKPKDVVIDPRKKILRMSNDIRVAVLVNRGEELANDMEYNRAIDEFQKAVDVAPHNTLALFRMGEALFELGNLQAAAQQFRASLDGDLQPKWVEVWAYLNLGKIYDIRGQRERAVTEYQKAVNAGDDAYGAQAEAQKYLKEPFRRSGKTTIGD